MHQLVIKEGSTFPFISPLSYHRLSPANAPIIPGWAYSSNDSYCPVCRLCLKCDGTCAETKFHLSAKQASPFELAGASVQLTAGSGGVLISGSNAGYTMF